MELMPDDNKRVHIAWFDYAYVYLDGKYKCGFSTREDADIYALGLCSQLGLPATAIGKQG
jgi:hypothetical protein